MTSTARSAHASRHKVSPLSPPHSSTETTNNGKKNQNDSHDSVVLADTLPLGFPWIPIGHPDTMMSKESVRRAVEEFKVRPTDVIVSTFSKTGTTLVLWICHLLRTFMHINSPDGDVMVEETITSQIETLYEVVPWPLLCYDIGYDPNVDGSQFFPRVFKSHLRMASVYRGCRYVVTVRDPAKTTLSFYNFLLSKEVPLVLELPDVTSFLLDTPFVQGRPGRASLWEYYQEYHLLLDCDSVLFVVYEDLVGEEKSKWVRAIGEFMMSDPKENDDESSSQTRERITPATIDAVCKYSTKEFMSKHNHLFDEPYERAKKLGRAADLSQLAPGKKIALSPHPQTFDANGLAFFHKKWTETMKPLGYDDYNAFAVTIRERNRKRFKF